MIKIKTLSKDNFASKAIKYILYSIINILAYIPMLCAFKYNQTLVHPITTRGASNISPVSHPQLAMPPWAGPRGSLALLGVSSLASGYKLMAIACSNVWQIQGFSVLCSWCIRLKIRSVTETSVSNLMPFVLISYPRSVTTPSDALQSTCGISRLFAKICTQKNCQQIQKYP